MTNLMVSQKRGAKKVHLVRWSEGHGSPIGTFIHRIEKATFLRRKDSFFILCRVLNNQPSRRLNGKENLVPGTTGFEEKKAPGLERPALAVKGSNPSLACLDAEDFQPLFRQQLLKQGIPSRRVDSGYLGYAKPFPFLLRTSEEEGFDVKTG